MTGRNILKRAFDIIGALLLLILLSPLLAAIALGLLAVQGAPVLYRETRVGMRGRPFTIYKFRTMRRRANDAASVAASDDPRITRAGKMLKPSRLDELPQLLNVLKGDMSLVGPRPLPATHLQVVDAVSAKRLLDVRPGITTPASIEFIAEDDVLAETADAEETYLRFVLPAKVAAYLDYVDSWTLPGDLKILAATLVSAWSRRSWQRSRDRLRKLVSAASS